MYPQAAVGNYYNLPLYSKVRDGRLKKYPLIRIYRSNFAQAWLFAQQLSLLMENNGKCGLNQVIYPVIDSDYELPANYQPKDMVDWKLLLGSSQNPSVLETLWLPGLVADFEFTSATWTTMAVLSAGYPQDSTSTYVFDRLIKAYPYPVNVSKTFPNPFGPEPGVGK